MNFAWLLAAACTTIEVEKKTADQLQHDAGSFRICDCLLPGEIHKLGDMVFLGPRRPVKTSTRDCDIRGGEYVAYDRADYATALRYWLPQARDGDPVAQTYVGEIFEKGPAGLPDYVAAAHWYRQGAEKGYARAAINLGVLYERGLGVAKDPKQALDWYRRASGLPGLDFTAASGQAAEELRKLRGRVSHLESRLKERQAEVDSLRRRLAEVRGDQGGERKQLQDRLTRAEAERATYEREARELRGIIDKQRKEIDARVGGELPPIAPAPRNVSYGNYHALVIGISEYRHLPQVDTAVRDAEEIARILRDQYDFKVRLQSNARGDEIKAEMVALRETLRREDNLLIYYAGRCELEPERQSGYWLPFDAQRESRETWIPTDEIARNLDKMQASQVIVVVDSCYEPKGAPSAVPRVPLTLSGDRLAETLRTMARQRSRMVLTSGGLYPLPSQRGQLSAFAEAFLQVLQENSGVLLGEQLFRRLQARMPMTPAPPPGSEGPSYAPIKFVHDGGDFIFVRTGPKAAAGSAPDPSPLARKKRLSDRSGRRSEGS